MKLHVREFRMLPIWLQGMGAAALPYAPARKYPSAACDFGWQYVLSSVQRLIDPIDGIECPHHFDNAILARGWKAARHRAGIVKQPSAHTLQHSFATYLLERGYDIGTVQALLGRRDVAKTPIYTHVLNRNASGVLSPLDR